MDVLERIKKILSADVLVEVAPADMQIQDSLREGYGIDSLGFIELRAQCEDEFGVEIGDDAFVPENFETLGSVTSLVETLLGQQRQSSGTA